MRFCFYCGKPMYTSMESVWIKGKNYNCHVKCSAQRLKELGKNE